MEFIHHQNLHDSKSQINDDGCAKTDWERDFDTGMLPRIQPPSDSDELDKELEAIEDDEKIKENLND
ncbi:hypothetical protein AAHB37_04055 [Glutamicibacter halophytocola]